MNSVTQTQKHAIMQDVVATRFTPDKQKTLRYDSPYDEKKLMTQRREEMTMAGKRAQHYAHNKSAVQPREMAAKANKRI